jgi:hypothetical protein
MLGGLTRLLNPNCPKQGKIFTKRLSAALDRTATSAR